jgi:hypothetical protein
MVWPGYPTALRTWWADALRGGQLLYYGIALLMLGVLKFKRESEMALEASGIDYTIFRWVSHGHGHIQV